MRVHPDKDPEGDGRVECLNPRLRVNSVDSIRLGTVSCERSELVADSNPR